MEPRIQYGHATHRGRVRRKPLGTHVPFVRVGE